MSDEASEIERLRAEVARYDVAQMRGWSALREAYAVVADVPFHVAKYERDASTLPELARALVAERDQLREALAAERAAGAREMRERAAAVARGAPSMAHAHHIADAIEAIEVTS